MKIDLSKTQEYLNWLSEKLFLDAKSDSAKNRVIKRGEVYWCHFGKGIGSEQGSTRPAVILQYDIANLKSSNTIVAPITHTERRFPTVVFVDDKYNDSGDKILNGYALLGNIVCVSKSRLGDYITCLNKEEMEKVNMALIDSVGLRHTFNKLENRLHDLEEKLKNIDKNK